MLILLWCHAAAVPVYALVMGFSALHVLAEGLILPVTAALAMLPAIPRRTRTAVTSIGLLSSSAILVHLSGGLIEMHFHFFVMVAVVALYQDWLPFLAAIAYVFVHHGVMGAIDPGSVYNHYAAQNSPWKWAGIHALFVAGISVACLVTWRLNERVLAERTAAEQRLREETRTVETMHEVGKTLSAELDTERVVQAVTDAATDLAGAEFGAFFYNSDGDGEGAYPLYALSGASKEAFSGFGLPRSTPIFAPTFAGEGVIRVDDVTEDPRYGQVGPHHGMPPGHLPVRSYLAVPVRSRSGDVLGGLFFGHPEVGRFTAISERVVVGIASQAAIALDNARLYESELHSRAVAEAASNRLALLAEASRILTASLEVEAVLTNLARLVNGVVSDYCAIDFVEDDGSLRRLIGGDVSGSTATFAVAPVAPGSSEVDHPVNAALRTGESQLVQPARDDGASTIVVPLIGRRGVAGAITLGTTPGSARHLGARDVPFAEELARRAALAVENARLFARQRSVAETLQHSLLPERLPDVPGVAAAARYLAGGPDVEVGGDWYDVIQLPSGRLGVAIGDVVGRGERAASLMGQLRNALRAYAVAGKGPADTMECLNRMLVDAGREYMATVVYGILDPESGTLHYVNAGHLPPLLARAGQSSRFLEDASGVPLGAVAYSQYRESSAALGSGDTLVLYTDGLVEERTEPLDTGMRRLQQVVAAGPSSVDELCAHIVEGCLGGNTGQDDAAVLAVRLVAMGDRIAFRLPAEPGTLAPLRSALRRWLSTAVTEEEMFQVLLACGEACTNAIRHGASGDGSHFEVVGERGDELSIVISDDGRWREPRANGGGQGLRIIESCVDDLDVVSSSSGTELRMRWRLASSRVASVDA